MNGWLHGWMADLSLKKNMPACMHIRVIMNKEKGKNNIKGNPKTIGHRSNSVFKETTGIF